MNVTDQVALKLIDVIRKHLPDETRINLAKGQTLNSFQIGVLRPIIIDFVKTSLVESSGGNEVAVIREIAEAVLRAIATQPGILALTSGTKVFLDGVEAVALSGTTAITFNATGTLSTLNQVVLDPEQAVQSGWFDVSKPKGFFFSIFLGTLISTPIQLSLTHGIQYLTQRETALQVLVIKDAVRVRLTPSIEGAILGHLSAGEHVHQIGAEGDWRQVISPALSGWVHKDFLIETN